MIISYSYRELARIHQREILERAEQRRLEQHARRDRSAEADERAEERARAA